MSPPQPEKRTPFGRSLDVQAWEHPPWEKINTPSAFHVFTGLKALTNQELILDKSKNIKNPVPWLLSWERGWMIQVFLSFPSKGVILLLVHLKATNFDAISFNFTCPKIYNAGLYFQRFFQATFLFSLQRIHAFPYTPWSVKNGSRITSYFLLSLTRLQIREQYNREIRPSRQNHIVKQAIFVFLCSNRSVEFPIDITWNTEIITSSVFYNKLPGIWEVIINSLGN